MSHPSPLMSRSQELLSVPHLPATLRARRRLILVGALTGLLLGTLFAGRASTEYTAMATVQLGGGYVQAGLIDNSNMPTSTQAQLAELPPQIEELARRLDADPDVVSEHLQVAARDGTALMDFTYSAPTAADAEEGALRAAEVYIEQALTTARAKIDARMELLRQKATLAPEESAAVIASELSTLELTVLDPGTVVRQADGTAERSLVMPVFYVAIGLIGGTILGCFLALIAETLRPRIRRGVAFSDLRLMGHVDDHMRPEDAELILLPAIVTSGSAGLTLAPLGENADAVSEMFSRTIERTFWVDPNSREGMAHVAQEPIVLVVREGERLSSLHDLLGRLEVVGARITGMVTASAGACDLAEEVLAAEFAELHATDDHGTNTSPSTAGQGTLKDQDSDDSEDRGQLTGEETVGALESMLSRGTVSSSW